jgi:hypothetical protein
MDEQQFVQLLEGLLQRTLPKPRATTMVQF